MKKKVKITKNEKKNIAKKKNACSRYCNVNFQLK